jgi:hypothetical protein
MVTMKQLWLSILFTVIESLVTATFISTFKYLSRPTGQFAEIDVLFRNIFGLFAMRIYLMQVIVEVLVIFFILRFGGWEKYWLVLIGVFGASVIWGGLWGLAYEYDFTYIMLAVVTHGFSLFLGALTSWWICYKWFGLKA